MADLILNSFPVEILPHTLSLPFVEYETWEASTDGKRRDFPQFRTYRYETESDAGDGSARHRVIRLVLLSGTTVPRNLKVASIDTGEVPNLGANLIDHALASHFESQGMILQQSSFQKLALRRTESSPGDPIQLYSGIAYRARRPFRAQPHAFTLSVQWVARALFADTLTNPTLRDISEGLGVLYTPRTKPPEDLQQFENHFIGRVRELVSESRAVVTCRDNAMRTLPLAHLKLEASPEAIRRYERMTGSQQHPSKIWRRLQQISKVLTNEGRRNSLVIRDRLDAIRGVLGGHSKEHLVLPLNSYAEGTVSVGLSPIRLEISS